MNEQEKPQSTDPRLDVPAEANREKHINFRDGDETTGTEEFHKDDVLERRKQWEEGLEEGRRRAKEQRNED